jgi:hypothetical protein
MQVRWPALADWTRCVKYWAQVVVMAGIWLTGTASVALAQAFAIDAIQAYAGTWKTETEHFDTPYSKAGREASTLRNECWKNGGFLPATSM